MRGSLKLSTASLPPGELDASAQGSTTYYFPHLAVGRAAGRPIVVRVDEVGRAREVAEGELVIVYSGHVEREGAVDALVLFPGAGVGAGQAA